MLARVRGAAGPAAALREICGNNKASTLDKLLCKLEENEPEMATSQEDECVICVNARATMQTFPCSHRVVCRKCFVKTIQMAVSQRLLPLRCVICRSKILRLKQGVSGGVVLPTSASQYCMQGPSGSGANKWDVPASASLYSMSSGASSLSGTNFEIKIENDTTLNIGIADHQTTNLSTESERVEGSKNKNKSNYETTPHSKNIALEEEILELKTKIPKNSSNVEIVGELETDMKAKSLKARRQSKDVTQMLDELKTREEKLKFTFKSLDSKKIIIESETKDAMRELWDLVEEKNKIISRLRMDLDRAKNECEAAAEHVRQVQHDHRVTSDELRKREKKIERLTKDSEGSHDRNFALETALREQKAANEEQEKLNLKLKADLKSAKLTVRTGERTVVELQTRAAEREKELSDQISALQHDFNQGKHELERVRRESALERGQLKEQRRQSIQQLEAVRSEREKNETDLKRKLDLAEASKKTLFTESENLKERLISAKREFAEKEAHLSGLVDKSRDKEQSLQAELANLRQECTHFRKNSETAQRTASEINNQFTENRRASLAQIESLKSQNQLKITELMSKLKSTESERNELASEIKELRASFAAIQTELEAKQSELTEHQGQSKNRESSLRKEIEKLKQQCHDYCKKLGISRRDSEILLNESQQRLVETRRQSEADQARTMGIIADLESKRRDSELKIVDLETELDSRNDDLQGNEEVLRERDIQIKKLEVKVAEKEQEIEKLRSLCERTKRDHERSKNTEKRNSEMEVSHRKQSADTIASLQAEVLHLKLQLQSCETVIERLNSEIADLVNQHQASQTKLQNLGNVVKENDKLIHKKSSENANFRIELAELRQKLKDYEDQESSAASGLLVLENSESSSSVTEERTRVTSRYRPDMQPLYVQFNARTHNVTKVTVNHNKINNDE
ncbi:hypothetical protein B566_EDAN005010 [Ephemera danica]|nr:hypothetical protein B566_EDAN005010 [Ephemera danica]